MTVLRGHKRQLVTAAIVVATLAVFALQWAHAPRVQASPADTLRARYRVMSHAISGDVEASTQNLGIFGGFVGLELAGRGTTRAEFAGTLEQPRLAGQTDLADVVVQGISIGGARGRFEISREGRCLLINPGPITSEAIQRGLAEIMPAR